MSIVLVTNNAAGVFQAGVSRGAAEVLAAAGVEFEVVESPGGQAPLERAEGLLVLANVLAADTLLDLQAAGKAITLVSHDQPGSPLPTVMHDNLQGMTQLLDWLFLECGCSRPLLLGGDPSQLDASERERAFGEYLMRRGLDPDAHTVLQGDFEPETAAQVMRGHLAGGRDFDCIAAADYLMALAVLPVLDEAGLTGLPIAGFGDGPEAAAAGLTTVAADVVELGRRAARQLLGQLPDSVPGRRLHGRTLLATQLVRRSVSPVMTL